MSFRKAVIIFILLELSIIICALSTAGFSLGALQTITAYSGRLSLIVFSLVLISQAKKTEWLSSRPYAVFAIVHGIHLLELVSYVYLTGKTLVPYRLAGGILAYIIIFSMPLLQHYYSIKKISAKQFSIAENIFQLYVWLIFFITYLTRYLGKVPGVIGGQLEQIIFLSWVIMLIISTRILSLFQLQKKRVHKL
jgi:hypothetical protein